MAFLDYHEGLLVPEVLVEGNKFKLIRQRPTYDDLIGFDTPDGV